ncbi:MAG: metallophosphoesterase, partial [Deltaproteobacteria bacterium]|nr:metallophosphoesterase [Deltaproteobacteria bacterium]
PDLVVITGDLADGTAARLADEVAPISALRARRGVYFVTGNHEYFADLDGWLELLPSLGVRVLMNERVAIDGASGAGIDLIGVPDPTARRFSHGPAPDLDAALAGRDPRRPAILLAHQPREFDAAAARGIALTIAGHTHGGQIWPFGVFVERTTKYLAGLYRQGAAQLYVSRGTGVWGPPMRLFAPAEITRLVLTAARE